MGESQQLSQPWVLEYQTDPLGNININICPSYKPEFQCPKTAEETCLKEMH
jgi:hypothetical protein